MSDATQRQRSSRALLEDFRAELADLAFDLERQRRLDAADVVMMLHARVRELTDESSGFGKSAACPRGQSSFVE